MKLPDATRVYCGHEYTLNNGRFALTLEPENEALVGRMKDVESARVKGAPTIPSTIGLEKATNPFLRPNSAEIRSTLGLTGASDVAVFAEMRKRKDSF
jgi:hydroxyacylglutathione hydrolase